MVKITTNLPPMDEDEQFLFQVLRRLIHWQYAHDIVVEDYARALNRALKERSDGVRQHLPDVP